jgi:signal transduction histidine kinase
LTRPRPDLLRSITMKVLCRGSITACPIIILITVILSLALSLKYFYEVKYTHFSIESYPYLRNSFSSSQYRTSLFSTVLIGIPMTIESLIDGFSFIDARLSEKICWATRFLLVLSLVLPKILLLVGNFRSGDVVQAHLCSIAFINIASRGCLCIFLCLNHQKLDIGPICVSISIFYLIGVYMQLTIYSGGAHPALSTTSVFFVFAYGQFTYVFCRLLRIIVRHRNRPDDICTVIYFVGLLVLAGGSFLVDRYFGGECTQLSLSIDNYLIITFLLIIALLPGQLVKLKYKEALQKMEEKDAFIRYISHEIRTPLNTVFLGMSYIKGELRGIAPLVSEYMEPIIETVNEVNECCEVAVSILNDLLTFDKLEEGKMALELKDTDVESFVFETVKPFHILAREKDIALNIIIDGQKTGWTNLSTLRIDRHKMSQVIRNLVSNAIKFTPPAGNIDVTVSLVKVFVRANSKVLFERMPSFTVIKTTLLPWLTYFSTDSSSTFMKKSSCNSLEAGTHPKPVPRGGIYADYLRLEVKDNGVGISSVNQTKLFGQYVQFNAGKLQEGNGSGLGLWISKAITELHGGALYHSLYMTY